LTKAIWLKNINNDQGCKRSYPKKKKKKGKKKKKQKVLPRQMGRLLRVIHVAHLIGDVLQPSLRAFDAGDHGWQKPKFIRARFFRAQDIYLRVWTG
jgi:hypothetical protein